MKTILRIAFSLLFCVMVFFCFCSTAFADNTASGIWGNLNWTLDGKGTLSISGTGDMDDFEYESTSAWHAYRDSIGSVIIEPGVTSIGDYAFNLCTNLTDVTIPVSVTSIGIWGFNECNSLTSVVIPEGVTSIGEVTFSGCHSMTNVTIPKSVTNLGDYAFEGCSSLSSVTIPSNVTNIGEGVFSNCSGLTSMTIPESITSISKWAFNECSSLKNIMIPATVTNIDYGAFRVCSSLKSLIIPANVTSIGDYAFYNCSGLTSMTIPSGITSIGEGVFSNCSGLTSLTIPSGVTSIGKWAFYECSSLADIMIPSTVTSIDNGAFKACKSLTSLEIPDSVTSIGWYVFNQCTLLTKLTIPSSVTSIGGAVYDDCPGLKTAGPIGSGCNFEFGWTTRIPDNAFYGCNGLSYLMIPSSVTSIGESAFKNCPGLKTAGLIGSGSSYEFGWTTKIPDGAFNSCRNLTSVTIPSTVTIIGANAFSGCLSLTEIIIPLGVTDIGEKAFYCCRSLTNIAIPAGLTSISYQTFDGCESLTSVTIPKGVTNIDDWAFTNCTNLTNVTIPDGVTSIGEMAFGNCGLTNVTIPSSVTSIGIWAFSDCPNLTNIRFLGAPPTIGIVAFAEVTATAYYPVGKGWTSGNMQDYGGNLTWVLDDSGTPEEKPTTTTVDFYNFAELEGICKKIYTNETIARYASKEPLVIEHNLTIPKNLQINLNTLITGYPNKVEIPTGVTLNIVGRLSVQNVVVDGTIVDSGMFDVYNSFLLNGAVRVSGWFSEKGGYTVNGSLHLCTDSRSSIRIDKWDSSLFNSIVFENGSGLTLDFMHSIVIDSSFTIPSGANILMGPISANGFSVFENGEGDVTIANGVSVTISSNSSLGIHDTVLYVNGKLINNERVLISSSEAFNTVAKVVFIGDYSGSGSFIVDNNTSKPITPESCIEGLDLSKYQKNKLDESGNYWEFTLLSEIINPDIEPDFILPANITSIEAEAFAGGSFVYVVLPDNPISIGWHAFADCPNLTYIYIPSQIKQIDAEAFGNRTELTIIGNPGTIAQTYAKEHNFTFITAS